MYLTVGKVSSYTFSLALYGCVQLRVWLTIRVFGTRAVARGLVGRLATILSVIHSTNRPASYGSMAWTCLCVSSVAMKASDSREWAGDSVQNNVE